jgi:serine/threonine protein kinase/TolB-like protein
MTDAVRMTSVARAPRFRKTWSGNAMLIERQFGSVKQLDRCGIIASATVAGAPHSCAPSERHAKLPGVTTGDETAGALRDQLQGSLGTAYTIERELGGGGMSRVFVATETTLGRRVVVKVLPPELAHSLSVERFRREIALAARLQHPHIVPLLTAGETEGLPYYTMPFVDGESLRARLGRLGALPVGDIVRVLRDVAGALAYAHEQGVVHRDIKPENVLLTRQHALVADFGVAKALSASVADSGSLTGTGIALGTPDYIAPEQAAADPATDGRADLYALGAMAYEMLTGTPPFPGRSVQATLHAHATEPVRPVSEQRATTPDALADLVMRCLEKRPADRPQSADEVLQILETVPTTSGSMARTVTVPIDSRRRANGTPRSPGRPVAASGKPAGPGSPRAPGRAFAWMIGGSVALLATVAAVASFLGVGRSKGAAVSGEGRATVQSVAVLPFADVGHDTTAGYFAEGMADELTTALGRVPGLRVAARSSAFTFRDQGVSVQDVGTKLHVGTVLEGTVRRAGGRLRVTAQLVNATDGLSLWSQSYEREMSDVFQVQDELARDITTALYPTLGTAAHDTSAAARLAAARAPRGTQDLDAYDLFLQGRYYSGQGNAASLWRAASLFQDALAKDSTFARADAALAMTYDQLPAYGGARADSVIPLAEQHAGRALARDPGLPDAHLALGDVRLHQWRWADAERELGQSVAADPSNPIVHRWHSSLLLGLGQVDEAVGHAEMAYNLDPLTPATNQTLARALLDARRYDDAAAAARRGLASDATLPGLSGTLMEAYLFGGHVDSAVAVADRAIRSDPAAIGVRSAAAWVYAGAGRRATADSLLVAMRAALPSGTVSALDMADVHLALGHTDSALVWVTRSIERHDAEPVWDGLACDPTYDALRRNPKFIALMQPTGMRLCAPGTAPRKGTPMAM